MNDLEQQLEDLEKTIATLNKQKLDLTVKIIRECKHEYIASTSAYPHGRETIVCQDCGISMSAGITGRINTPLLSFANSKLIVCSSNDLPRRRMHISEVAIDALKYPKRFSEKYLKQILEGGPYTYDEVMNAPDGFYSVHEVYDNYDEWYHCNYNV